MIEFYCAYATRDNRKPTQLGGAGVVMIYVDSSGRSFSREFGWALGSSGASLAEIQSVRLALCSVLPQFRGEKTTVYTTSKIAKILSGEVLPKENQTEIDILKKWYGFYKDIDLVLASSSDSEHLVRAKVLARQSLDSSTNIDSGTIMLSDINDK